MAQPKNKRKARQKRIKFHIPIALVCYTVVVLAWLGISTARFVTDGIARSNGTLYQQTFAMEAFEWKNLEKAPGGALRSTTDDPQLILDVEGRMVRTLHFAADFSLEPLEMSLYYTTAPEDEFSQNKRVWPTQMADGSYTFTLPRTGFYRLRLDAASRELTMRFSYITLNEEPSAGSYFNPGPGGFVLMLTLPALAAAALRWLLDMLRHYRAVFAARKWLKRKKQQLAAEAAENEEIHHG